MGKLTLDISMSLDGFVAGPNPSRQDPLGEGGTQLHEWVVRLASWRGPHGEDGGETGADDDVVAESLRDVGAHIMGKRMFGGEDGPWGDEPWEGWWGDEPPFHTSVFVLTHHEREPLVKGETTFHFVTDGIESALEQARAEAGDQNVSIGGGADVAQQFLNAGLLDEFQVHVIPIFLGTGTRLFDGLRPGAVGFEPDRVIGSPGVTHLRYRVLH
jgi:dihydrofolate reductase